MRWVTQRQLSEETGVPTRTLQWIVKHEPGELVTRTQKGGKVQYQQPQCAIRLRDRDIRQLREELTAKNPGTPIVDAELRKKMADAEYSELRVLKMKGILIEDAVAELELDRILSRLAAAVASMDSRYAEQVVGLRDIPQAILVLRTVKSALMAELQREAERAGAAVDDLDPDPPPEAIAA